MLVDSHEHDLMRGVPDRLPASIIREMSRIEPHRALLAVAAEWLGVAAAVALYMWQPGALTLVIAVIFIGARQHAMTVLVHDACHYRFLRRRWANELFGNLLLGWPMFMSVAGFRKYHSEHHKHFNEADDGNRVLWRTHGPDGQLRAEWVYPKTRRQLALLLLRHTLLLTGVRWILRGVLAVVFVKEPISSRIGRVAFYAVIATLLTTTGHWREFLLLWLLPMCTWHIAIQYMRIIAEHSSVRSHDDEFRGTRTTLATPLERLLMLPRNVGYHIEHHWYPSVPFYRLPELHNTLMGKPRFAAAAEISPSLRASLSRVTRA